MVVAALSAVISISTPVYANPSPRPVAVHNQLGMDNPSGKQDDHGRPLQRAANKVMATPQATATTADTPECPPTIHCVFVPAAHVQNSTSDDYGNYDIANRPEDGMAINQIVIHDTEGSLASTLAAFQDPTFYVSAHYVIDADGTVYQMVHTKDVAWHAGNWFTNMHSVGIEHVGHAASGATDYTPAMYKASAELVKYLANRYNIPLDRAHIIGHDNVPAPNAANIPLMHWDPGPYWNWQYYMTLLGSPVKPSSNFSQITVAPIWPLSKQPVSGQPQQATNFVYLNTQPDEASPLLSDLVLGQGTTAIDSVAAKAYYGQRFVVEAKQSAPTGCWFQVYYNGQEGWIFSPANAPTVFPAGGATITPKAGMASIPVYGRSYPDDSVYPANVFTGSHAVVTLPYTIAAGQQYVVVDASVTPDYFFGWTFDRSLPYDGTVFAGTPGEYVKIQFNGREAFVKRHDISLN